MSAIECPKCLRSGAFICRDPECPREAESMASVTGRKDDTDKPRWDLLPLRATSEIVDVLTYGARKYDAGNWEHVDDAETRYVAALERHLVAWRLGERNDPESDLHHLAHAGCCLLFLLSADLKGR